MMTLAYAGSSVIASFLASLVEFVEALTVILAVGSIRGWRSTLTGATAGVFVLVVLVIALGQSLLQAPLVAVRLLVGTLALLFGTRWLRKAILRATGVVPLHDEITVFKMETTALGQAGVRHTRWDAVALATSFKIVMLEGMEVVFIVIALGASSRQMGPALAGAAAAFALVCGLGVVLRRPLANVPENTLKYAVGLLLCAFGTFWSGEGLALEWPLGDLSVLMLAGGYLLVSQVLIIVCRRYRAHVAIPLGAARGDAATQPARHWVLRILRQALLELFIDDGFLAAGVLAWIATTAVLTRVAIVDHAYTPGLLFFGVAFILVLSAGRAAMR
ncbi:COG4280 domain-containing protein [Paraburkholderia sp. EG286B]|uniref:COG4280 domain-containing protein n=1 Tax=Paraburkholderia sp. EG286B TaxID=3237011 RepID=UPI0034D216E1